MSLINDALKRAKQAQQNPPKNPQSGPQLRPVEPAPRRDRNFGPLLLVVIVVAVAGLAAIGWMLTRNLPANTEHASSVVPSAPLQPVPAPVPAAPASTPTAQAIAAPQVAESTPSQSAPVTAVSETSAPPPVPMEVPPASVAAAPNPPPKPALPRLQAIFFNPVRPSAIIGDKTVFVGDRIGEFRVARITHDSATISNDTQNVTLTLE